MDQPWEKGSVDFSEREVWIPHGERRVFGKMYVPGTRGTCRAVIMSHGYNGCHKDFQEEGRYFASHGILALAIDFCGGSAVSRSSGDSRDMTVFTEKEDLLAVFDFVKGMEETQDDGIFLFGGSQGGLVTALAAEERRDAAGLILYYPAFNIPDDWRKRYPREEDIPEGLDFWDLPLGKGYFTSIRTLEPMKEIGGFRNRVLIIHGADDVIVPLSYQIQAQRIYEDAQLTIWPKEGHGFSPKRQAEGARLALYFMQS
ncbi:MAG: alpha/beta hydrolase [Eubacteriales bacterium]|nr:alpha/beta hydrolase [Eubacteriales bacterium]